MDFLQIFTAKMMFKNIIIKIIFIFPLLSLVVIAQEDTLSFESYLKDVIRYHPQSLTAELNTNIADANWKSANGLFDPLLNADYDNKYFDDKQYFQILQSNIELPTYLGLTFNAGYDFTRGVFLNPENNTPTNGLGYLGIEANLLQGLLIDERRTASNQAEIFEGLAKNRRQIELNDLIMEASIAYFQWQAANESQIILEENIELAKLYFENNLESFKLGDKPAVDTLESYLVLQDQLIMLQSYQLEVVKKRNNLKNYIWDQTEPLDIDDDVNPSRIKSFDNIEMSQDSLAVVGNPIIEEKKNKRLMLLAENELKSDKLKPKLKIKYNALTSEVNNNIPTFNMNNYKWGLNFSMPLLFRKELGEVELNELKIKETEYDIINKENTLLNKQLSNFESLRVLKNQLLISIENVDRYKQLLELEYQKFEIGESSVFLINKRQEKYIFSKIKVIDLTVKYNIEILYYLFLSNQLEENFK